MVIPFYKTEGSILLLRAETRWKRPCYWEGLKAEGEGATEDEMVG